MGISRIDQPEKHNHGYYVRVTSDGKTLARFFADKANGGKRAALRAAKEHEADLKQQVASKKKKKRPEKKSKRNKSGIVGVSRTRWKEGAQDVAYWQAAWIDGDGRRRSAKFSIAKYGEKKAMQLAERARKQGLRSTEA